MKAIKDVPKPRNVSKVPKSSQVTPFPPEMIILTKGLNATSITAERNRVWMNSDPLCSHVLQFVQSDWPDSVQDVQLKSFATRKNELSVQDGCIPWGNQIVIPKAGHEGMLRELHKAHLERFG